MGSKTIIGLLIVGFISFVLVSATDWSGLPLSDILLLLRIHGVGALVAGGFMGAREGLDKLVGGLIASAIFSFLISFLIESACSP